MGKKDCTKEMTEEVIGKFEKKIEILSKENEDLKNTVMKQNRDLKVYEANIKEMKDIIMKYNDVLSARNRCSDLMSLINSKLPRRYKKQMRIKASKELMWRFNFILEKEKEEGNTADKEKKAAE